MTYDLFKEIQPISNRELFFLIAGVYIGIIANHMELWLVW